MKVTASDRFRPSWLYISRCLWPRLDTTADILHPPKGRHLSLALSHVDLGPLKFYPICDSFEGHRPFRFNESKGPSAQKMSAPLLTILGRLCLLIRRLCASLPLTRDW